VRLVLARSPAEFRTATLLDKRSLRLRLSCFRAGFLSLIRTVARPRVPIANALRPTTRTRAAVMFAFSVTAPVTSGVLLTTILRTPRLPLNLIPLTRGLAGGCGPAGGGGGGAGCGFGSASAASVPAEYRTSASPGTKRGSASRP